jgi:hypothetical protein
MISEEASTQELLFPKFEYHLDDSDPDIVVLRRQDDAFVAAFSARGATREGIVEAAKEDYRELLSRVHWAQQGEDTNEQHSAEDLVRGFTRPYRLVILAR